jgi:hypothetical protein
MCPEINRLRGSIALRLGPPVVESVLRVELRRPAIFTPAGPMAAARIHGITQKLLKTKGKSLE